MKNVIVFAGSSSRKSINKELANYAASLLDEVQFQLLDLNDFPLPLFSVDVEQEVGFPKAAQDFLTILKHSDGILLSLAEHNGSYTVVLST